MLRLLADENFNDRIVRGLLRRLPTIDIIRAQDVGMSGATDDVLLEWAAQQERVLVTHDLKTVPRHAYDRVEQGQAMAGVFVVSSVTPVGTVIDDLLLVVECSLPNEWDGQVRYLPL